MEYFVTGATGFLGTQLVHELVAAGHDVVALVRTPEKADRLPSSVQVVEGDITEKESMREGMTGVDGVFHLAAWYKLGNPDVRVAEAVNVAGTRNVLELMGELDIPKGVYTSSLAVKSDTKGEVVDESCRFDGRHLSVYDRTKWEAHYEVAEPLIAEGVPLVIVLPGVIYGPDDRGPTWLLWAAYLRDELPVIPRQTGYCFGHIDDTVNAHVAAMDHGTPGEEYIIAGEPYTLVDAFGLAEDITGIRAPRSVPPVLFRGLSRVTGVLERVLPVPQMYQSEPLRVLGGATYWGDNSKAERELGITHRAFEDGLLETLEYEQAQLDT